MLESQAFWCLLGILIGVGVMALRNAKRHHDIFIGTLREDRSDMDCPYYFLEIEKGGIYKIHNNRYVEMEVLLEDYVKR